MNIKFRPNKKLIIAFIIKKVLFFLLLSLFSFHGIGQNAFKEVDALLLKNQRMLGGNVSTLVLKDGKIIYKNNLGAFNENTVQPIASCSKWFTAALVMTFVEEGKLSLEDPVGKFLPEFATGGKEKILLKHCLAHTTGIESGAITLRMLIRNAGYKSLEAEVMDISKKKMVAPPSTEFRYGNIGLNIAGRILEVIAKKDFETIFQERIGHPVQMSQTTFHKSSRAVNPSGGAQSTAKDYLNFLQMILDKGSFEGKNILSPESIKMMQQSHTDKASMAYAPASAEGFMYGFGEWIQERDANGNSMVLSSPGLFGTWPWVDVQNNYAAIIFVKHWLGEKRAPAYLEIKSAIDKALKN